MTVAQSGPFDRAVEQHFLAVIEGMEMDAYEAICAPTLAELDRCIGTLGFRGLQLYSNINDRPLDAPEFRPVRPSGFVSMVRPEPLMSRSPATVTVAVVTVPPVSPSTSITVPGTMVPLAAP